MSFKTRESKRYQRKREKRSRSAERHITRLLTGHRHYRNRPSTEATAPGLTAPATASVVSSTSRTTAREPGERART